MTEKKPIIEFLRNGALDKGAEMYACGNCGQLHTPYVYFGPLEKRVAIARASAQSCCVQPPCAEHGCGELAEKGRTLCSSHREAQETAKEEAKFQRARKYVVEDVPDMPVYYNDEFYDCTDTLCEKLEGEDPDELSFPIRAWLCIKTKPELDYDHLIENFEENLELSDSCDMEAVIKGLPELKAAVQAFNDAQTESLWYPAELEYVEIYRRDVDSDEVEVTAPRAAAPVSPDATTQTLKSAVED
jgi:hypothetical protein